MYSFYKMFEALAKDNCDYFDSEGKGGNREYVENGHEFGFWVYSNKSKITVSINIAYGVCYCQDRDSRGHPTSDNLHDILDQCDDCWIDGIIRDEKTLTKAKFLKLYKSEQLGLF